MTPESAPPVRYARNGATAVVTLDSQSNRNALSRALMSALDAALDQAEAEGVRVVLLTNDGPAFCAGADLKERTSAAGSPSPGRLFRRLLEYPLPILAVVRGAVRAGGLGLVAAADLVIATPESTFAAPEVQRGLVPALIAALCVPRVATRPLQRYFLTGDVATAEDALAMGLITAMVPAADLDDVAARWSARLALGSPQALATTKRVLRDAAAVPVVEALAAMEAISEEVFRSADGQEGMRSFLERRAPAWQAPSSGD